MIINLIRHGRTEGNLESRYIGIIDEPLCAGGISELKAKEFPECDAVICSPMIRCIQTADIIYSEKEPIVYEDLRECNFGAFEGQSPRELSENPFYQKWLDSDGALPFPGGEMPEDFKNRTCEEFLRAVSENPYERLSFVVHGGTIMSIMERFCKPKKGYFDYRVNNGCGYCVSFDGETITFISEIK